MAHTTRYCIIKEVIAVYDVEGKETDMAHVSYRVIDTVTGRSIDDLSERQRIVGLCMKDEIPRDNGGSIRMSVGKGSE